MSYTLTSKRTTRRPCSTCGESRLYWARDDTGTPVLVARTDDGYEPHTHTVTERMAPVFTPAFSNKGK